LETSVLSDYFPQFYRLAPRRKKIAIGIPTLVLFKDDVGEDDDNVDSDDQGE
jgi:hypothetical protein